MKKQPKENRIYFFMITGGRAAAALPGLLIHRGFQNGDKNMKIILFLLSAFLLFGSCATSPEKPEFNYSPPVEIWLVYFESGFLSGEEFLCLVRGSLAVKEMEAIKITALRRGDGGMGELARKTGMKTDELIRKEKLRARKLSAPLRD